MIEFEPISHTKYNTAIKKPNRINKIQGNKIKSLYLENDIEKVSQLTGKSVEAVTKYLEKHKLL
jgi:hypothetical protein